VAAYFLHQAHATDKKAHIGRNVSAKDMWREVIVYEDKIPVLPLRNLVAVGDFAFLIPNAEIVVLRIATHIILVETDCRAWYTTFEISPNA
jgi:hypothetical protein